MFIVSWNDQESNNSVVTEDHNTAWKIYWYIKQSLKIQTDFDAYLTIMDTKGHFYNPEEGPSLPPIREEGQERILLNPKKE